MKRQYLETIACVSLVAYAAIVLAAQLAHSIPGLGCGCHLSPTHTHNNVESINDAFRGQINLSTDRIHTDRSTHTHLSSCVIREKRNPVVAAKGDCLICHWFSMAQEQVPPSLQMTAEVPIRFAGSNFDNEIHESLIGLFLPRGPPLS